MKNLKFMSALLAAGLLTAACSDTNDILGENGDGGGKVPPTGTGYFSMSVNMPMAPRANRANDNFHDGDAAEYAVKNAILLLFKGTSSESATLAYAFKKNDLFEIDKETQITSSSTFVQEVSGLGENEKYYPFVLLNPSSSFVLTEGTGELEFGTGADKKLTGKTFDAFLALTESFSNVQKPEAFMKDGGFFMCNAPLYNVPGGSEEPKDGTLTYMPEITKEGIFSSKEEAARNISATVNVERAVAKVTVKGGTKLTNGKSGKLTLGYKSPDEVPEDLQKEQLNYTISGWELDCVNKTSYVVRKVPTGIYSLTSNGVSPADYRFVGNSKISSSQNLYRIYWAEDKNYSDENSVTDYQDYRTKQFNCLTSLTMGSEKQDLDESLYCPENTFDVANQNDYETTRAVVKVNFHKDAQGNEQDFYTINGKTAGVKTDWMENPEQLRAKLKEILLKDPSVADFIAKNKRDDVKAEDVSINITGKTPSAGAVVLDQVFFPNTEGKDFKNTTDFTTIDLKAILNANADIQFYANGNAYYPVHIKHFGDEQTPWNSTEKGKPEIGNIYPNKNAANYLGRYGVVRNNWYELIINSISYLGSPTIPEFTDDEDDTLEAYISVTVNVLAWALRKQDVDL